MLGNCQKPSLCKWMLAVPDHPQLSGLTFTCTSLPFIRCLGCPSFFSLSPHLIDRKTRDLRGQGSCLLNSQEVEWQIRVRPSGFEPFLPQAASVLPRSWTPLFSSVSACPGRNWGVHPTWTDHWMRIRPFHPSNDSRIEFTYFADEGTGLYILAHGFLTNGQVGLQIHLPPNQSLELSAVTLTCIALISYPSRISVPIQPDASITMHLALGFYPSLPVSWLRDSLLWPETPIA